MKREGPKRSIRPYSGRKLCAAAISVAQLTAFIMMVPAAGDSGDVTIRTVAGGGGGTSAAALSSNEGDGGPATSAKLRPEDVEIDGSGVALYMSSWQVVRLANLGSTQFTRHGVSIAPGTIATVAGILGDAPPLNRVLPFNGDDKPATQATLGAPEGLALDSAGNLFIADSSHRRVRKVDSAGKISTVAGTGTGITAAENSVSGLAQAVIPPINGDGGQADAATLSAPSDVAVNSGGELFIVDSSQARVRKVDLNGVITTVAGSGASGFAGDGGPADRAKLSIPAGVTVNEDGNLLIADEGNRRIRFVNLGTTPVVAYGQGPVAPGGIETVAGNTTNGCARSGAGALNQQLARTTDLAVDGKHGFYLADQVCNRVHRVSSTGQIETVAGTGMAAPGEDGIAPTSSKVTPFDVAVDHEKNVYIPEGSTSGKVRVVGVAPPPSPALVTVAGGGAGPAAGLESNSGDGGGATEARITPFAAEADPSGHALYISSCGRVRLVNLGTTSLTRHGANIPAGGIATIAGGIGFREVDQPAVPPRPCWDETRAPYNADGIKATSATLGFVKGLAIDGNENLFIADSGHRRIRKVDAQGNISTVAGTGTGIPEVDAAVSPSSTGDGGPAGVATLQSPEDVAFVEGELFIADSAAKRVRRIDANGTITTFAGNGTGGDGGPAPNAALESPTGVSADRQGNILITDASAGRIRFVNRGSGPTMAFAVGPINPGAIATVAGKGQGICPPSPDGKPAIDQFLNQPRDAAVDVNGHLLIAHKGCHRIQKVDASGEIDTVAGTGAAGNGAVDANAVPTAARVTPDDVAVDDTGNYYVAEVIVRRVRRAKAAAPPPPTVPDPPEAVTTKTGNIRVKLSWTPPKKNGGAPIIGYSVYRTTAAGQESSSPVQTLGPVTTFTDRGLVNGKTYFYRISASNIAGESAKTTEISATPFESPEVADLTPFEGPSAGGTPITITGSGFLGTTAVTFGEAAAKSFSVKSDESIEAINPPHSDGTVNVTVVNPKGASWPDPPSEFTYKAPGTWKRTAFSDLARTDHTASLLPDGRVLVAGTAGSMDDFNRPKSNTAEFFLPGQARWTQAPSLNLGRVGHRAVTLSDGKVLVVGGANHGLTPDPGPISGTSEIFDASANSGAGGWALTPPLAVPRLSGHTASLLGDGKVLVTGGLGTGSAELFDPKAVLWLPTTSMSKVREGHTATVLRDGRVLVTGGCSTNRRTTFCGTTSTSTAEIYDSKKSSWSPASPMSTARANHTATLLPDGRVLVAGGAGPPETGTLETEGRISSAEIFDPKTGRWTAAASLAQSRSEHTATLTDDGKVVVAGGYPNTKTTEVYDAVANIWEPGPLLGDARYGHTATLLPNGPESTCGKNCGRVLVVGGFRINSAEIYVPTPVVTGVSPPGAPVTGGDRITISGTGLSGATEVLFGKKRVPATASAASPATTLTAVAPPHHNGVVEVKVTVRAADLAGAETELTSAGGPGTLFHFGEGGDCPATPVARPGQVLYPSGYSIVGLPEGSRPRAQSSLYNWFDAGRGGRYSVLTDPGQAVEAGRGYWAWFVCPRVVDLAGPGTTSASFPLGAFKASMVGNPSGVEPVVVTGHDYAARWDPVLNGGLGGYRLSAHREPMTLQVGEGMWVFSLTETTIKIGPVPQE